MPKYLHLKQKKLLRKIKHWLWLIILLLYKNIIASFYLSALNYEEKFCY